MDERLTNIEAEKQAQLQKSEALYNNLLQDNQNLYNQQQNYANQYETTQNDILDKQLAYNTNLIEQQKEIARQNKSEEERKARNTYDAYQNRYGSGAESLANSGLSNSGYALRQSDSANVAYQNRLAMANKTMQDAITQYDNDINQARLNNDVAKAQNALEKLKMQLSYSESYYTKKADTMQNQFASSQNIDTNYYNRYQTEYQNIQNEKARQEAIRQWEAQMAYQRERDAIADAQWEKEYNLSKSKITASGPSESPISLTDENQQNNGNYQIVSTDENGWGETNLTQRISDGSVAKVYRNPQGELLFWDSTNNQWVRYGGNVGSGGGKNAYGTGSSGGFR